MDEPSPTRAEMSRRLLSLFNSRRGVVEWRYPRANAYDNPIKQGSYDIPHDHDQWWSIVGRPPPMQDGYFIPIPLTSNAIFPVRCGGSSMVGDGGSGTYLRIDHLDIYRGFQWLAGHGPVWTKSETTTTSRFSIRPLCRRTYIFRHVKLLDGEFSMRPGELFPHFILRHKTNGIDGPTLTAEDEIHFEPWTWTDWMRPDWSKIPMRKMDRFPGAHFLFGSDGDDYDWMACNQNPEPPSPFPAHQPFYGEYANDLVPPPSSAFNFVADSVSIRTGNMIRLPWASCACYGCMRWDTGISDDIRNILDDGREFTLVVNAIHFQYMKYEYNGGEYVFEHDIDWNVANLMSETGDFGYAGAYGQVLAVV